MKRPACPPRIHGLPRLCPARAPSPAIGGHFHRAEESRRPYRLADLETGFRSHVRAEVTETGSGAVRPGSWRDRPEDARRRGGLYLSGLHGESKCGLSEFNILGTARGVPRLPSVDQQNALAIGQPLLPIHDRQTRFASATTRGRPVHTGSLFEVDDTGSPSSRGRLPGWPCATRGWRRKRGWIPSPL